MDSIIKRVIKFTEKITDGKNFNKAECFSILRVINSSKTNLNVYKGLITIYYFLKFKEFPEKKLKELRNDGNFIKCLEILKGKVLDPEDVGSLFLNILNIPDEYEEYRNILMGCFYGAFWPFMNNPKNFEIAIKYGLAIIKSAFSLDNFNIYQKLNIGKYGVKVISLGSSGKKEIKLVNISSLNSIITTAVSRKIRENIVVTKTVSKAVSSITGSRDIFEILGVNLNLPINRMVDISLKTGFGIFDINTIVPKLNHIYDGRLYNVQVFAGLVGGAAIVNPVQADLINYGLTRGSTLLCLNILSGIFNNKKIIVIQGKSRNGKPAIDQVSIMNETEIATNLFGKEQILKLTPRSFGFDFRSLRYIKSKNKPEENVKEFIKLLAGKSSEALKEAVAMEVALNLLGIGLISNIKDLKDGIKVALEVINSGSGIGILEELIISSGGNLKKLNDILENI